MSAVLQHAIEQRTLSHRIAGSMQLVSFWLTSEEYALESTKVQEIILPGEITSIPQSPDYLKGVIDLRGAVLPIVDLRLRFEMPAREPGDEARIMVVNVRGHTIGMIVDSVSEVLQVAHDQVVPPPPTVAGPGHEYITGLVQLDDRLLILLDIDYVLDEQETTAVASVSPSCRC